ncbi:hypothetical protein ACFLIM_47840 [Nonomuraea sp. M3C6]|uniref:Uncharacterized protein n=1 Tax=Nonomuraea marmarensis TaxID=3351344 RepID=A0ABW7AU00_9ACTN
MRLPLRALVALAALAGAFLISTPAATAHALTSAATYRGEGDDVVRIPTASKPSIVKLTHRGESNFAVWTLTTSGKQTDLLANEIGDYKETAAFNVNGTPQDPLVERHRGRRLDSPDPVPLENRIVLCLGFSADSSGACTR